MKKGLILRIVYLTLFFVLSCVALIIYPRTNTNTARQSIQSGNKNWTAPALADSLKNPLAGNLKAAKEGQNLFKNYCITCHGESGRGNGPQAASLNVKPKDLTSKAVQKESDGALFWKISTGNPPMLAWKYTLSKMQRWQLIDYIRQIEKNG